MKKVLTSMCRHVTAGVFIAAGLTLQVQAQTQAVAQEKIPVEKFFKNEQIRKVQMSPNGKSIAMLVANKDDRLVLSIMDIATSTNKIIAAYAKTDVSGFFWITSERLVFTTGDRLAPSDQRRSGNGMFAVNKDGAEFRQLTGDSSTGKFRVLDNNHRFLAAVNVDNSNEIYLTRSTGTRKNPRAVLIKLDTISGKTEDIPTPANSSEFFIDRAGLLRIAITLEEYTTSIYYKDEKTQQFRKLLSYDNAKDDPVSVAAIAPDGQIYVTTNLGQDTTSVYRYDLEKNKIDETPVATTKGFDFSGRFLFSRKQNKLLGITFESDAEGTIWFDDTWKTIQAKVDKALPNTVNFLSGAISAGNDLIIVHSTSDIHPGSHLIFNTKTEQFTAIGDDKPEVDSSKMSYKDFVKIKVRDGMEIPAYLTLPRFSNGKNLPLVVMVHGGPYMRGVHWKWNKETQFLASRGYAVLEPEFRGSEGYGKQLHRAGWKQWGLAMQDDVTDATKWAIEKGYADPKRICIAGASYGGYAVLMGLIKEPDMYRCGISWVGVSDINLMYDVTWSDFEGGAWQRFGMPILVGDQVKDAAQLKATSPVEQAHRLTKPLILAYGSEDARVPFIHGEKFKKNAPANAKIDWIVYKGEGHGWHLLEDNVDFWTRAEKFLEENTAVK
ncbi:MAG: alpha/beta fold hydrolase [Pseudomonadota bacterium]